MIFQSMKMAWHAVVSNKLRSFLTMLGIIIGGGGTDRTGIHCQRSDIFCDGSDLQHGFQLSDGDHYR